jgi:hypothetical protein
MSTYEPVGATPASASRTDKWKPTKKWLVGFATAAVGVVAHLIVTGEFDGAEQGGTFGALLFAVAAYIVKNPNTLQGKWPVDRDRAGERGQSAINLLVYLLIIVVVIVVLFALLDRL